jgi:hypothetical protein
VIAANGTFSAIAIFRQRLPHGSQTACLTVTQRRRFRRNCRKIAITAGSRAVFRQLFGNAVWQLPTAIVVTAAARQSYGTDVPLGNRM